MKEDMSGKAKELLQKIKEAGKDYWKNLLEKLGLKDKRALEMHAEALMMHAE